MLYGINAYSDFTFHKEQYAKQPIYQENIRTTKYDNIIDTKFEFDPN